MSPLNNHNHLSPLSRTLRAALAAAALAPLVGVLPTATAFASSLPGEAPGVPSVNVPSVGLPELGTPGVGAPTVAIPDVTVEALAAALHLSRLELVAKLESLQACHPSGVQLCALLGSATGTIEEILVALEGKGVKTAEIRQALETMLGGSVSSAGGSSAGGSSGSGARPGSGSMASFTPGSVGSFQVISVVATKTGRVNETIGIPGPGSLVLTATERRTVATRSSHSKHGRRHVTTRVVRIASLSLRAYRGIAVVVLNPKLLTKKSRLVIATTYTPFGGTAMTITRSVVVKRASSSRRKHR